MTGAAVSAVSPAHAVQLGEITVQSTLGQPLSAQVQVEIGAGEVIGTTCLSTPTGGKTELKRLPRPLVSVPDATVPGSYDLRITTVQPLYEPMYELQLEIRCPGTAFLVRQYVLMLDLPGARSTTTEVTLDTPITSIARATSPAAGIMNPVPRAARSARAGTATPPPVGSIEVGSRYRVAAGDTLSTIAARVSNRHGSLWAVADRIFSANPDAFIGANPDLLMLGSEIIIPLATDAMTPPNKAVDVPLSSAPVSTPVPAAVPPAAPTTASMQPVAEQSLSRTAPVAELPLEVADSAALMSSDEQAAGTRVFQDEPATPIATAARPRAAPPAPAEPADVGAPAWLAALIGVLIGAAISAVLLRDRLLSALRPYLRGRNRTQVDVAEPTHRAAPSPQAVRRLRPAESTMMVVEETHDEIAETPSPRIEQTSRNRVPPMPPAARDGMAEAGVDLDSDLTQLFSDESLVRAREEEADLDSLPAGASLDLDLDLTAAIPDVTVDQDIGWIGDETALGPTQEATSLSGTNRVAGDQIDLASLSQKATSDKQISQTLKDALNLLESDYEDEFTASQVIDRKKLDKYLEDGEDDDTLARTGTDKHGRR